MKRKRVKEMQLTQGLKMLFGKEMSTPARVVAGGMRKSNDKQIRAVKKDVLTEAEEQIRFAVWLDNQKYLYTASANGGSRNLLEAVKLKRMGVKKGYPDITILEPQKPYHGLFIELKRVSGGVLSDEQKYWLEKLKNRGYRAEVAKGFEEAKKIVMEYFGHG
jgi:hypothetical protein